MTTGKAAACRQGLEGGTHAYVSSVEICTRSDFRVQFRVQAMAIEPVFSKMSKNVDYEYSKMNYDYSVLHV